DLRCAARPLALLDRRPAGGGADRRARLPHRHGQGSRPRGRPARRRVRDPARRAPGARGPDGPHPRVLRCRRSRPPAARRPLADGRGPRVTLTEALPTVNAALNATSACALFLGYWAVRTKRYALHWKFMAAAFTASSLFLVGYVTRFALTGV